MKAIFTFIILIVFCCSATAQNKNLLSVKTGLTFYKQSFYYDNHEFESFSTDTYTGFNFGLAYNFYSCDWLNLLAEVNYFQKGVKLSYVVTNISEPDGYSSITRKEEMNYLNLSLLAKCSFLAEPFAPYFLLGPKLDYRLNSTIAFSIDQYDKFVPGARVGGGFDLTLDSISFLAEIIYDFNFSSLIRPGNIQASSVDLRIGVSF